jgi:alkylhydroperoxidase family enzyme
MPYIQWIDEDQAEGELGSLYADWLAANPNRDTVPEILKCFSQRSDVLRSVLELTYPLQFADGHLTRRTKEMIATLVSGLNQCHY